MQLFHRRRNLYGANFIISSVGWSIFMFLPSYEGATVFTVELNENLTIHLLSEYSSYLKFLHNLCLIRIATDDMSRVWLKPAAAALFSSSEVHQYAVN